MNKILITLNILISLIGIVAVAQLDPGMTKKTLTVISTPQGAEVFLKNGNKWELLGKTPLTKEIKIGEKEIKIILKGYEEFKSKINTQKSGRLNANLKLIPESELIIKSEVQAAEVWLNNKKIGTTNKSIQKVKFGKYQLMVKKEGYETIEQELEINQITPYELSINPKSTGPVWTGDPAKDIVGEWEAIQVPQWRANLGMSLPVKYVYKADGTNLMFYLFQNKEYIELQKNQFDFSKKPFKNRYVFLKQFKKNLENGQLIEIPKNQPTIMGITLTGNGKQILEIKSDKKLYISTVDDNSAFSGQLNMMFKNSKEVYILKKIK